MHRSTGFTGGGTWAKRVDEPSNNPFMAMIILRNIFLFITSEDIKVVDSFTNY